jgi:hypothetical protein
MDNQENINLDIVSAGKWLRSFKGCEHYSDEEALAVSDSLNQLASILLRNASQKIHTIDNQHVVYLNPEKQHQKLAA